MTTPTRKAIEADILRTSRLIDRALDCRNKRRFIELCRLLKQQKARKR